LGRPSCSSPPPTAAYTSPACCRLERATTPDTVDPQLTSRVQPATDDLIARVTALEDRVRTLERATPLPAARATETAATTVEPTAAVDEAPGALSEVDDYRRLKKSEEARRRAFVSAEVLDAIRRWLWGLSDAERRELGLDERFDDKEAVNRSLRDMTGA
jgi:hypothetical protein